ncbi:ATP-binding protein [Paenibacillus psychroresistens]|uniref:ATP-binding protein n=1 Tax=Paenibacillus psychroresistens TaxID=1778678 RepID=A0A6B8RLC2_9BACL|nr:AAA family ATPase [Paenibacillus psychroresistens]QGQ96422.1 ATP-binding protein [Paenibacillus psychroresistens]
MKRFLIITVGKTHSGKTKELEQQLHNSLVIDQDNHAEFINTYYKTLMPEQGPYTFKYAVTQTIVNYAVNQTDFHLILCNSNRHRKNRLDLLEKFHNQGFISILVNFDIPDCVLMERIAKSQRSTTVIRGASNFEEVLILQQAESQDDNVIAPAEGEADYSFVIKDSNEVQSINQEITNIAQSL